MDTSDWTLCLILTSWRTDKQWSVSFRKGSLGKPGRMDTSDWTVYLILTSWRTHKQWSVSFRKGSFK